MTGTTAPTAPAQRSGFGAGPLFQPIRMGDIALANRIVMAPLTRMRAANPEQTPTALHAEYYAQRASAGLIVSEGTSISREAVGWADTPGIWSTGQIRGWQGVTQAVHATGGRIVAQLWHTGAISHPAFGTSPLSASDVNVGHESVTPQGRKPTVVPRPMTQDDIRRTVGDYARAARNAMDAGFDGVQIQANYLYLIAQFLNPVTNRRTDDYGGDFEGRARFLFEIVEAVLDEVDPVRVGVRIGPMHEVGAFAAHDETLPMAEYAVRELNGYGLAHLMLMGATTDFAGTPLEALSGDAMFRHFRPIYRGTFIANVAMAAERGSRLLSEGAADMIAFGRAYIANPDLVERLASGAPLAQVDWSTVYASGAVATPTIRDPTRWPMADEAPEEEIDMPVTTPEQNKAIALEAFDTLFNKRDYAAAERFWSAGYIQHRKRRSFTALIG